MSPLQSPVFTSAFPQQCRHAGSARLPQDTGQLQAFVPDIFGRVVQTPLLGCWPAEGCWESRGALASGGCGPGARGQGGCARVRGAGGTFGYR